MSQSPKTKQKKKPSEFTTDEVIKKMFPKKVVKELKKITGKKPPKKDK
jgi:hypothetical protein